MVLPAAGLCMSVLVAIAALGGCGRTPLPTGSRGVDSGTTETCSNGAQDGSETDVDCGGSCAPCPEGSGCGGGSDCESGGCSPDTGRCTSATGRCSWARRFGGGVVQHASGVGLAEDGTAFFLAFGSGPIDFGGGPLASTSVPSDVFVASHDSVGNHRWSRRIGSEGPDRAFDLALDPRGGVVLAGESGGPVETDATPTEWNGGGDMLVVSLDPTGRLRWARAFGGAGDDYAVAVAVGPDGRVYVMGTFEDSVVFGDRERVATGQDAVLLTLEPDGAVVSARALGGPGVQVGGGVALGPDGRVVIGGSHFGPLDVGGDCGTLDGATVRTIFVATLDERGECLWARSLGRPEGRGSNDLDDLIVHASEGDVFLAGHFQPRARVGPGGVTHEDSFEGLLARLAPDGSPRWIQRFPSETYHRFESLALDGAGNLLIAGGLAGTLEIGGVPLVSEGSVDALSVKLRPSGAPLWARTFGARDDQRAVAVAVQPRTGRFVMAATLTNVVDFGAGPLEPIDVFDPALVGCGP